MTPLHVVLAACVIGSAQDTVPSASGIRALALRGSDSSLARAVRASPVAARDALALLLAAASRTPDTEAPLLASERLAVTLRRELGDSFPARQVARFAAWDPAGRRAKVSLDSLRREGNAALGRNGFAAALPLWQESAHRAELLRDTAGVAAATGNVAAGWYAEGVLDSAARYFDRAALLARSAHDERTALNALGGLANVRRDQGDLAGARVLYDETSRLRTRIGDERGLIADRINSGILAEELGDLDGAAAAYADALARSERLGLDEPAAASRVNRGLLAALRGDFALALADLDAALATYRRLGLRVDEALVLRNLGLTQVRRGEYGLARRRLLESAAIYARTGPVAARVAVMADLARLDFATGRPRDARRRLDSAAVLARAAPASGALLADVALARADIEAGFNRQAAAERAYRDAELLYRRSGNEAGRAMARAGRGYLLLVDEDFVAADALLRSSASTQDRLGLAREAALTRLDLAAALSGRGLHDSARVVAIAARDTLVGLGDGAGEAAAQGLLAGIELELGRPARAEAAFRAALARLSDPAMAGFRWSLQLGLARSLAAQGAYGDARSVLRDAVAGVERSVQPLGTERRSAFMADKWELYAELSRIEATDGSDSAAFAISERLRSRELFEQLAHGRIAWRPDGDTALVRQEQDLRRTITELAGTLAPAQQGSRLRGPASPAAASAARREALAEAEQRYATLLEELRERAPAYASTIRPRDVPWQAIAARLPQDAAVLEYLVADSGALAFVVTRGGVRSVELGADRHAIVALVEFVRGALAEPPARGAGDAVNASLQRLHRILIEPVEQAGWLAGIRRLLLVPHGELHYLPFAALRDPSSGKYLVERFDLAIAPSASTWLELEGQAPPGGRGLLAMAPETARLPGSAGEVRAIGAMWGDGAVVLEGARAGKDELLRRVQGISVLHLAGFGVLNRRSPLFSYVELAPTNSVDGRLEVHEVFGLRLDARLVVLSACQTAVGSGLLADVPAGDDWVSLARAFLAAGSRRVVASLWLVEDRPTGQLMTAFHRALVGGLDPAAALANAQRTMLRQPGLASPYYWAGFETIGGF